MSRFTQYLDIAGRPSRSDSSPLIVAAAVAFPTDAVATVNAAYTPPDAKWSSATDADVRQQVGFLLSTCTAAVVFRVAKTPPAWAEFWTKADQYHAAAASIERRAVGFLKAGTLLRYWLFGEASARVMGDCVRLTGRPLVLTEYGLGSVESTVVCDSDIQGDENVAVFTWLFEQVNERPQPLLASAGIQHHVRECRLATEQAEPLLYLADYLAGLFQVDRPSVAGLATQVRESPKVAVVDYHFDVAYDSIFGSTGVGQQLWPDT